MKTKIKALITPLNILLVLILLAAFFVRVYRIDQLLGFYFDQGRDALVIWDFWHKGKFFLIGPTTGIEGVFRGPWYYWLIAPFYLIGKGNPVWPSVFLSATSVVAVFLSYKITETFRNLSRYFGGHNRRFFPLSGPGFPLAFQSDANASYQYDFCFIFILDIKR